MSVVAAGSIPLLEFHTLGWRGFQDLCGTVLGHVLGQTYQVWSPTRDGGRDGAFVGQWSPSPGTEHSGAFVVQCKHASATDKRLRASWDHQEFDKIQRLATTRGATIYLLLTNLSVTGVDEEWFVSEVKKRGIATTLVFGAEWLSRQVWENARLRALIPRVYGLGDLGEILDQRASGRARSLLQSMSHELRTFVRTGSYIQAQEALAQHGSLCLVGEPGSGKSAIAAVLVLSALDQWHLDPVRVYDPLRFDWNPRHGHQIFWADDAFGETQYEHARTMAWRQLMPELRAARDAGCRFIFTSRDYIYRRAVDDLRRNDLAASEPSRVVIKVENLSLSEKEEILYNHIKLGNQPRVFRTAAKALLPIVARGARVLPEVARRLGNTAYTTGLSLTEPGIQKFTSDPDGYLLEVIKELPAKDRACLLYLFAHGGQIALATGLPDDDSLLVTLGTSSADVREALISMRDSFVRLVPGEHWTYQHPTVHDALTTYVAKDPTLVAIYLRGAAISRLLSEATLVDEPSSTRERIVIPRALYGDLVVRLMQWLRLPTTSRKDRRPLFHMLAARADSAFLTQLIASMPELEISLVEFSWIDGNPELGLLSTLNHFGLLNEDVRAHAVERVRDLAIENVTDTSWLSLELLNEDECRDILCTVQTNIIDNISEVVDRV